MTSWSIFGPRIQGRACGRCRFCCKTVPVRSHQLDKPGGIRCQHLRSTGCGIYQRRPDPCAAWNCTWLYQPAAAILKRPDIGGYAVDPMPQEILINGEPIMTIQVWVDPDRREAYRAPELRAYLEAVAADTRMPAIVRWPNGRPQEDQDATILFAPCLTDGEGWQEVTSGMLSKEDFAELQDQASGGRIPSSRDL